VTNVLLKNSYKKLSLFHFFSQRMKTVLLMKNTMNTLKPSSTKMHVLAFLTQSNLH